MFGLRCPNNRSGRLAKVVASKCSEARNLVVAAPRTDCVKLVSYFVQRLDGEPVDLDEVRKVVQASSKETDARVLARVCEQLDAVCGSGTSLITALHDYYCGPVIARATCSSL